MGKTTENSPHFAASVLKSFTTDEQFVSIYKSDRVCEPVCLIPKRQWEEIAVGVRRELGASLLEEGEGEEVTVSVTLDKKWYRAFLKRVEIYGDDIKTLGDYVMANFADDNHVANQLDDDDDNVDDDNEDG